MNTDKKTPFYSQKLDGKYTLLNRSIGIDTQTKYLSTRTIESSSVVDGDMNGKQLIFNFAVSPSAYLDWNNSRMEIGFVFTTEDGQHVPSNVSIPWNLILYIFEEIKVKFNGIEIFNKVSGEYLETQTFKLLTEYSNKELNASEIVFAPIGDYNYNNGVPGGFGFNPGEGLNKLNVDQNAKLRFENWISAFDDSRKIRRYKRPTFKELFFDMPGFSKNLRNVAIEVKLKNEIPLAKITHEGDGIMKIKSMNLKLHEYNFSPSSAVSVLNDKLNNEKDEHISFIDVNKQDRPYSNYLTVTNQENVQWVAVTQFAHEVVTEIPPAAVIEGAINKGKATYQNCGNFLLLNGYATESFVNGEEEDPVLKNGDVSINFVLHRSDLPPTQNVPELTLGSSCSNPISSIQAQYGKILYPSNAIETQKEKILTDPELEAPNDNIKLLKTDELYSEYKKSVGFKNPAVPEDIFRRTMPFFLVRFTPNLKLIQTGDIIIRMPGFSYAENNVGARKAKVSIIYGQLKSYNISPSGIVSESISSF